MMMTKDEFKKAIYDEYDQVEESINELIPTAAEMTVSEVLAVRDRVVQNSINWYVNAEANTKFKEENALSFMTSIIERADSEIATRMFSGYKHTLQCDTPVLEIV